jgi:hypothetical protein
VVDRLRAISVYRKDIAKGELLSVLTDVAMGRVP